MVCLSRGATLVLEAMKFTAFPQFASTLIYTTAAYAADEASQNP